MTQWIDGTYTVGQRGFLIEKSNPISHTERFLLTNRPAYTNQSHEPRLYGWCGSWNDTNTYAHGIARAVRVAGNDRTQIVLETDTEAIKAFLDEHGFPELMRQYKP